MQYTVSCNFAFSHVVASYEKSCTVITFVSYYMQLSNEAPTTSSTQDFANENANKFVFLMMSLKVLTSSPLMILLLRVSPKNLLKGLLHRRGLVDHKQGNNSEQ